MVLSFLLRINNGDDYNVDMISISVIIPTFNRLHTLPRALQSVLKQTIAVDQIIVIDDGSTDDTAAWVQQHHPQVELIQQQRHGVSHARNHGIEKAKGEWIALLDSDDAWLPNKLALQLSALKHSSHLLCHTNEIWIRNGTRVNAMNKHQKRGGNIFSHCLSLCCISPSSALIHREVFTEIGLFDESLPACEDYDFWLRFCSQHAVSLVEDAATIKYGGHDDQLSKQYWGMDRFRVQALENLLNSQSLNLQQQQQAVSSLHTKLNVLRKGALKHNNNQLLEYCHSIIKKHPKEKYAV